MQKGIIQKGTLQKGILQKGILQKLTLLITFWLCLVAAFATKVQAQTRPEIGSNYYIAAQTWDGSKYVERFLYLGPNNGVYQTTDVARASVWNALTPANGSGIALRTGGKFLMRGGITSSSWGSIIDVPTVTLSDPPAGSLTIKSTVSGYPYYVIAPNAGTALNGTNAPSEASYQPKTSLYTPYFKFYEASTPMVAVTEKLADGTDMSIGASYLFVPTGKAPKGGNLWPVEAGTITIEAGSYNNVFYTFEGFKVGNSSELVKSVSTDGITANTTIAAVFSTNPLEGQNFTFISSYPEWYKNQQVYKAVYLDPADNTLKWKSYDPQDDAFYFKAHGSFDDLTFESVLAPGSFITGAVSPVGAEAVKVELRPLGAGDYAIVANSQNFYAYGFNNGKTAQGVLSDASGTSGSVAAWWIQNVTDKADEAQRYQEALGKESDLVAESERQKARGELLQAIKNVVVGENLGNVTLDAYDLAVATYENNSLSSADYRNAITLLYSSCHVPGLGTKWRIINNASSKQLICVGKDDALLRQERRSSLYQMWIVEAINDENPTQLAFRNLGSGTYLTCNTTSSNSPTTTTDVLSYVNLNAKSPGVFSIEILGRTDQYIYLGTSPYGPAIIVNTSGDWRFEEVPPTELDQLSMDEQNRTDKRQELLDFINDVKTVSSNVGGIGYYATLGDAITAAQTVYNDPTRLLTEYQSGINDLASAVLGAERNLPSSEALYIICDHDGRIAMEHVNNTASLTTYNDTNKEHFWKLVALPLTNNGSNGNDNNDNNTSEVVPWIQHYTLNSIEGENTVLNVTAQLLGNDEYYITIDGDQAWNDAYGQTAMSIHQATLGEDAGYLTDGEYYRIRNAATSQVITRSETWTARVTVEPADETLQDWNQIWKVEKQAGADRYQFHNKESNRHIEEQMRVGSQLVAAFTPGTWHLKPLTGEGHEGQFQILTTMAPIEQFAIGYNGDKAVAVAQSSEGTAWILEKVIPAEKPVVDETALDQNEASQNFCKPAEGMVVRIVTNNGTACLDEYYKTNTLQHKTIDPKRYSQLWRLHHNEVNGLYKLENIYTGHYIVNSTVANNTMTTTADPAKAGEFAIARNKYISGARQYNILDANLGLGINAASNGNVTANGIPTKANEATTAEFRFKLALDANSEPYTEADYQRMRDKFEENRDILNFVSKYDQQLRNIFADRSYTTLRSDLTEETLQNALDQLPDLLVDMVNKIRNDQWPKYKSGTNWDKTFRIREYPVVSNPAYAGVIGCSYGFSTLNEPVGILAHNGDVIAVMVEDAPKTGAGLALQMVEGLNRNGTTVTLKQGLNLVQISEDCNLYINYIINSTADNEAYYLKNFPDIKIHIEGGVVYGCINRVHGPGNGAAEEADALWIAMQNDGLIKNGTMSQVVGESIMFDFNSVDMLKGCPEKIGEVIDIWDSWIKIQQWLMGVRDHDGNVISDYIPHLKDRFNNRWSAFERTGGFMNAIVGGAQYNTSTIQGILNYNTLSANVAWGPIHEHGHNHQHMINMCGMTEVSNNLFSNVNTREFGAVVSRGSSLPDAATIFAKGGNWYDNNIWVMTNMYFKLYLYYHVAGNKPTFYPEVFTKLRANNFLHNHKVAVPADRDYLQFAKICCEVAGEDLSEFFEAYGMLRPLTPEYSLNGASSFEEFDGQYCRLVGDYTNYHVYTTDQMIEDVKKYMQSCGPKNGNIMFIDDRVRPEPAAHPGAQPGQMRAERSDGGKIGAYGNVGMWDDFTAENKKVYAKDYTILEEWSAKGITLHISGKGAVGYKIYGPEGELVYFSAFNDILLPAAILEKYDLSDLVVVAAQADGTSVEITSADDAKYAITTYRNGSEDGITTTSTGRFRPELINNDVCVVEAIADRAIDEFSHPDTENVILKDGTDYNMYQFTLKDRINFYIPEDAVAQTAVYQRSNTTGLNSLCLPFQISESDFGTEAKIYTISSIEDKDGATELCLVRKSEVAAGEPCFVLCPEEDCNWNINVIDTDVAAQVQPVLSDNGDISINGSYTNKPIGAGKYKLKNSGDAFGITSDKGNVTAFRSYLETPANGATTFRVRLIDRTTGVEEVIMERPIEEGKIYDLMGRPLKAPVQGQPYILGGKVYYDR